MFSISAVAKMLGVKITDENIRQLEAILPQIPDKAKELVIAVNNGLVYFKDRFTEQDAKLTAVDAKLSTLVESAVLKEALDRKRHEELLELLRQLTAPKIEPEEVLPEAIRNGRRKR